MIEELDGKLVIPGAEVITDTGERIELGLGLMKLGNKIIATRVGTLRVEKLEKGGYFLYVIPEKRILKPRKGDIVIAEIINVGDTIAQARIFFILRRNDKLRKYDVRILNDPFQGLIHISYVIPPKRGRVKAPKPPPLYTLLAIGDKIIGRINVAYTSPYGIDLRDKAFGVVAAMCGNCGAPLRVKDKEKQILRCERCGSEYTRKISELYNFEEFDWIFRRHKERRYAFTAESE